MNRLLVLLENLATIYATAWGQCSEAMKANKVKSLNEYAKNTKANNYHWLLKNTWP